MKSFNSQFKASLTAIQLHLLQNIGQTAFERGESAYLVGGAVRDILLGEDTHDLDLVIEGKAISLAKQIAKKNDCLIKTYPRFGTATIYGDDFILDLVTARSETYEHPGALPTVQSGTIDDDLARRDFTINTMAVRLAPDTFGELLDLHKGKGDLKKKLIRILHPESFNDDPTRILRAIRYEQRLGFGLETKTTKLLQNNLSCMDTVKEERLWHEMELILSEDFPEPIMLRTNELGVLRKLYPPLKGDNWIAENFIQARSESNETLSLPSIYLTIMCYRFNQEEAEGYISRFKMPGWAARVIRATIRIKKSITSLKDPDLLPSQLYHLLEGYSPEVIRGTAVASDSSIMQQRTDHYLNELRYIAPQISGNDLQKIGVPPGREMGRILRSLKDARIDGTITSRKQEESFVNALL